MKRVMLDLIRNLQREIDWVTPAHPFQVPEKFDPNWTLDSSDRAIVKGMLIDLLDAH